MSSGAAPSGTVTFLFTDIEGSTRLWEASPDAMRAALERHDTLLRSAVDAHDGYVFATGGDGFAVAFPRAGDALAAAQAAQAALAGEPWPDDTPIRVRIGVHTGEASERGGDFFGPTVNRAARLMAVAHGGQVVCSPATAALAEVGVGLRSLGEHRLRDLAAAVEVFQVGDGSFPPLRSVDAVPTNLPIVRTELIGRSHEVEGLRALVERERLVTLTGVGGVGKTRLALGAAGAAAAEFADGCWLVELAPLVDGDEVVRAVSAAVQAPTSTADALAAYLADRRMLLVLDNCEHVLDAVADLVDAVLEHAAEVHVLVTSREPLGLDGEQVRRVQSLELPPADASAGEASVAPAVRLFVERAAAVQNGFVVDAGNVAPVVDICRRLDGIPLAIELAAARVRGMAPSEIAERLDERFRLLAGGSRRSQERHRTLLATVAWSYELLTEDERVVFRRLAVFPASFDLAAAEAVVGGDVDDVVDGVLRLVDRSLVVFEADQNRYRMLETLRQYGADRLAEAGETDATRERHGRHFLGFAAAVAPLLDDFRYIETRPRVVGELDNLRATAEWCATTERWAELGGLCWQLQWILYQDAGLDGVAWLQQIAEHPSSLEPQLAVDLLGMLAWMHAQNYGDAAGGRVWADRSIELASRHEGCSPSLLAFLGGSQAALYSGRVEECEELCRRALARAEDSDDELWVVVAWCNLSAVLVLLGDRAGSDAAGAEALRRAERGGHPLFVSSAVITVTANQLNVPGAPDFAAAYEILSGYPVVPLGAQNDTWLDIMWGAALLGLGRPGAAGHLARAARTADRNDGPGQLDNALRLLAALAAEAGLLDQARSLLGYADANLRPYRIDNAGQAWLEERFAAALAGHAVPDAARVEHRGEMIAVVGEVERILAERERVAAEPR